MKRQLEAPPGLPEPLLKLLQACLAHDAAKRCAGLGALLCGHSCVVAMLRCSGLCSAFFARNPVNAISIAHHQGD